MTFLALLALIIQSLPKEFEYKPWRLYHVPHSRLHVNFPEFTHNRRQEKFGCVTTTLEHSRVVYNYLTLANGLEFTARPPTHGMSRQLLIPNCSFAPKSPNMVRTSHHSPLGISHPPIVIFGYSGYLLRQHNG